ncbi:hypothetical protein NLO98_04130 [Pseudomonas syringae]|nr:hypothetical protein [Pseudomonas syringae]
MTKLKLVIESAAYDEFLELWEQGSFDQQRLGQAFYNHFRLHRVNDKRLVDGIYEHDGEKALIAIASLFDIQ